ncbi:MAG: hypothetical protein KDJ39_07200 [Gammaproteobacteria bacterium]|nr:hypothetical protein [Gammaproteobacteria bacterium]
MRLPDAATANRGTHPPFAGVALISAAALAYEILLTRAFAIIHWHHLVAIAISLALLGYGASGTFLALFGARLRANVAATFVSQAWLFGITTLLCVNGAQQIDLDPLAIAWDPRQIAVLAGAFLVLATPFFFAANCIGLALWTSRQSLSGLYAADLLGAAVGVVLLLIALRTTDPETAIAALPAVGALAATLAALALDWHPRAVTVIGLLLIVAQILYMPMHLSPSPYKDLSRALAAAGARVEIHESGIGGRITVVGNDVVPTRGAPGLSLLATALPPPQRVVFVDGDRAGTIADFRAGSTSSAYLSQTLGALPFALGRPIDEVAVLRAATGERVVQALDLGARHVVAVEPRPALYAIVCGHYAELQGAVCDRQRVDWHTQSARAFLASSGQRFDLISLAVDADPAGLDALASDHHVTLQAFASYLRQLDSDGVMVVEGPTRLPPRLSMRLLATARGALAQNGITDAGDHIVMLRDWNRFVILVSPSSVSWPERQAVRNFAQTLAFELVWLPGMREADASRIQHQAVPMFYRAARAMLADAYRGDCYQGHRADAISDDRPFPWLSTCWREWLQTIRTQHDADWAGIDTGVLIGVAVIAVTGVTSLMLIIAPLLLLRRVGRESAGAGVRLATFAHFGLIGAAFIALEIAWIDHLQTFLGNPLYATSLVLAGFLLFAGLGSAWAQRRGIAGDLSLLHLACTVIAVSGLFYMLVLPLVLTEAAALPLWARAAIAAILLSPTAFAMGIPFPVGLRAVQRRAPALLPWAWGINGCASVVAAASTPLLGAEVGFRDLAGLAAIGYMLLPLVGLPARPEMRNDLI